MENTRSKQTLKDLLTIIRDCETEKPLDEINTGLVEACVKLLLKLEGKEVAFTTEQIKEKVRNIPFVISADFDGEAKDNTNKKTKKHTTKKKILLVAAVIALLAMLMGIGYSNSKDEDFFRNIVETIGIDEIVFGETYTNDGISYQENEQIKRYKDLNEFKENSSYKILLPTHLPNGIETTHLVVTDTGKTSEIIIGFNTPSLGYLIYPDSEIPESAIKSCTETMIINNNKIYIVYLPDIGTYQMHFEYNGNYYYLIYTDRQELLRVIENMEE